MDILDADGVSCYIGDSVFTDDGEEFDISEIFIRDRRPTSIRSKNGKIKANADTVHHMSKGMRILYLSPLDYLSLSEEDQRQFTDDVQEAYDKIADRYFGIDDSLQESTKQIAKPPAEDKSNKSRSDKLKDRNAEIVKDYAEGYSYAELMKKYSLSEPSISTIIRKAQQ